MDSWGERFLMSYMTSHIEVSQPVSFKVYSAIMSLEVHRESSDTATVPLIVQNYYATNKGIAAESVIYTGISSE
jgi:hypothetical protein